MDRFFDETNLVRYRKLRDPRIDAVQLASTLEQLAEEEAKFKEDLRAASDENAAATHQVLQNPSPPC